MDAAPPPASPADEIAALGTALATAEARACAAEAEAARAVAQASRAAALIASLKLEIEKLRRELYGTRSERKVRLLDQLERQLEALEATASEDELTAERAAARTGPRPAPPRSRRSLASRRRASPSRPICRASASSSCRPRPPARAADRTSSASSVRASPRPWRSSRARGPRPWKVIPTVREKFACRHCETIPQLPAPFHAIPRGWAGPSLLAMILFETVGQHQPLNRPAERFAREGVELSLSTLADQVGTCAVVLKPRHALLEAHVMAAERLHGDGPFGNAGGGTPRCVRRDGAR